MKRLASLLVLAAVLVSVAGAAEALSRTYHAPEARTWAVTEAVLKHLGWEIEKADRTIGWITTRSRVIEGEDYGVYAKGTRHLLRVHVKGVSDTRSTVSVERSLFNRERILWMDKDEPVAAKDQDVEKTVLDAIGKSL
jgi:hypothetical protein